MRVSISIVGPSVRVLTRHYSPAIVTGRGGAVRLDFQACHFAGSAVLSIRERISPPYASPFLLSFLGRLPCVLGFVSQLLVRFMLANKDGVTSGWVSRLLVQSNVPFVEIWEVLHNMYESQVRYFTLTYRVAKLSDIIAT